MRPVSKGSTPTDDNGSEIKFKEYSRARHYLIDRIGEYCSYCERKIPASLAVEHVQPKSLNKSLELEWSNFLLGCTNCNSTKGDDDVSLNDYIWPDSGNTYELFEYGTDGLVKPTQKLSSDLQRKAEAMIDLVGLDKKSPRKGTVAWQENSDRRQKHRIQAIIDSDRYCTMYSNAEDTVKTMMKELLTTIVLEQGFWSIWMHAFDDYPEIQKEFIESYVGTNTAYFQNILHH